MELAGYCTRCRQPFTGAGCPGCDPPDPAPLGTFQVWHTCAVLPYPLAPAAARRLWRTARFLGPRRRCAGAELGGRIRSNEHL